MKSVSVIGVGNSIMGDDGVGVYAVWKLREKKFQSGVEFFDAGTDAFYALEFMDVMITSGSFKLPHEIGLLGVEPEMINWSTELSPKVKDALPALIDMVLKELWLTLT